MVSLEDLSIFDLQRRATGYDILLDRHQCCYTGGCLLVGRDLLGFPSCRWPV